MLGDIDGEGGNARRPGLAVGKRKLGVADNPVGAAGIREFVFTGLRLVAYENPLLEFLQQIGVFLRKDIVGRLAHELGFFESRRATERPIGHQIFAL